jgi:hypothetical protein
MSVRARSRLGHARRLDFPDIEAELDHGVRYELYVVSPLSKDLLPRPGSTLSREQRRRMIEDARDHEMSVARRYPDGIPDSRSDP